MKTPKTFISFAVFFVIISVCDAGRIASISQVQDNECVEVDLESNYFCSPCTINGETFYFSLFQSGFNFYSFKYFDPECYYYLGSNEVNDEQTCSPSPNNLCEFYVKTTAFSYFELDISSSTPINATFFARRFESTISQHSLVARGDQLESLSVQNENSFFRYEKRVSPSQYSSSLGVFSYGETYSQNDFKFTVNLVVLPSNPSHNFSPVLVMFYPFSSIAVTEEEAEFHFFTSSHGGEFFVAADSSYSLTGLSLSNGLYGVQNITLFPQFEMDEEYYSANVVAQLEGDSPFMTFPCEVSSENIMGAAVDIFDCQFESYSFSYGGGWEGDSSWSFDHNGMVKERDHRPDQMAFSLF